MALRIASALFVLASPLVLYWAVTEMSVVRGALLVAGWIAIRAVPKVLSVPKEHIWPALQLPLVGVGFAILGAIINDARFLLALPSLLQFGLAAVFGRSLIGDALPLVERFARMQEPELTAEKVRYCRAVTKVWVTFLVVSGILALCLAMFSTPRVWAIFTGVGSYALVALLFAVEYVFRQFRFRKDGSNWMQRRFRGRVEHEGRESSR